MPARIIPIYEKGTLYKYVRSDFYGSGVNSWAKPPAQNADFFEKLDNCFPGTDVIRRRWGYASLASNQSIAPRRLYVYQNDTSLARQIVGTDLNLTASWNESGTLQNGAILPNMPAATAPARMVNSRSSGYFTTGVTAEGVNLNYKWDGNRNYVMKNVGGFSTWSVNTGTLTDNVITDPNSVVDAAKFVGSGTDSFIGQPGVPHQDTMMPVQGQTFTGSVYLKVPSGTRTVNLYLVDSVSNSFTACSLTTSWQRFSVTRTCANTATFVGIQIGGGSTIPSGAEVHIYAPQLERGTNMSSVDYTVNFNANAYPVTLWGIVAPVTAISVGAPISSGSITLKTGRNYYVVYRNSTTGHMSDLNPVSASTGPLTAQNIPLSSIPVSSDPQVDRKTILATADGGNQQTLYFLADLPNATTTLTDNIPETTLELNNVYLYTDTSGLEHGVAGNQPPPLGTLPIKHKGRLWMIQNQFLYFSKSLDEVTTSTGTITGQYEECWPATYAIDVSIGAESPRALLSDGTAIYVATERSIRRVYGDNILNFSRPQVVFTNTGVLNQEVWQPVFLEGQPVGTIWLTPDFRILQSDFNSYVDIGAPIQDLLNTINTANATKASAMSVSDGEYDLYMLALPIGVNTECVVYCVYNLRTQTWAVWSPTDDIYASLFNINASGIPQPIFSTAVPNNTLNIFGSSYTQDRATGTPVNFTATVRTPFLDFQEPSARKLLNEIELQTQDASMTVTVEGASTVGEFLSPTTVVSNAALQTSPFGELKVYLAGQSTRDRYYRFTFTSPTNSAFEVLTLFNVELCLLHQL